MRRGPLLVVGLLALCGGVALLARALRIPDRPRSVVLITIDTLRKDHVGPRPGGTSLTPRIDEVASRGAVFAAAWTTAPLTVPAHATLLTGRLPPQHGLRTNRPPAPLAASSGDRGWPTLAEALRQAGCRTGAFVSASVLRADQTGLDAGFDVYDQPDAAAAGSLEENERRGDDTVTRALDWVHEREGPFFLWVHLFDPHGPYSAPAPYGAGPEHAADAAGYAGEVRYTDACVGRLLDGLGGRDDLVVAIVADHGEGLGEHGEATHGFLLHEATVHVPLVIACEGVVEHGTHVAEPRSVRDLAATLLALARVPPPEGLPGVPLLGRAPPPSPLYAETLYAYEQYRWAQTFAVRRGPWKLVDAGPELREHDLEADPAETSPRVFSAGSPPDRPAGLPPLTEVLPFLRAIAETSPPPTGASTGAEIHGPYWSPGAPADVVLPEAQNRALPSPYARIGDHAALNAGQALLRADRPAEALARFAEVAAADPANPQAAWWSGRAQLRAGACAEAARSFRAAYALGSRTSATVEMATYAALQLPVGDGVSRREADAFLREARGQRGPETGVLACFEAQIAHDLGDDERAAAALARARAYRPRDDRLERVLLVTEQAVEGPR